MAGCGAVLIVLVLMLGCGEDEGPGGQPVHSWEVRAAHYWYDDSFTISVPETVSAGIPFEISVPTVLTGCDLEGPEQVLEPSDTLIMVAPWDSIYTGSGICPAWVQPAFHRVDLEFVRPGNASIVIAAMEYLGAGRDSLVQREYSVVVE